MNTRHPDTEPAENQPPKHGKFNPILISAGLMAKRWRSAPWLLWAGIIILCGSWLNQNYFDAERASELAYLGQAQTLISIEEEQLAEWFSVLLVEQSKDAPKDSILLNASLKAAQHELNILTWAIARATDPGLHAQLIREESEAKELLRTAYEKQDTKQLMVYLNNITMLVNAKGPGLMATFEKKYKEARNAQALWRLIFLAAYGIGFLMIGANQLCRWNRQPAPMGRP